MEKSPAPALSRGLFIIDTIANNKSMSFSQLEKACNLNSSSLARLLKVLSDSGYIRKNIDGKYEIGVKIFTISQTNSIWKSLVQNLSPLLEYISQKYKVAASLYAYTDDEITVIDRVFHPDNIAMRKIGDAKKDYLLSPWGYLYLYNLPDERRDVYIGKQIEESGNSPLLPSEYEIEDILRFIQNNGYADDNGQFMPSVRRIAFPIYSQGHLLAALGIGSFVNLINESTIAKIADTIKNSNVSSFK